MSVRQHVDAKTLGKRYAELVRERDLPVQGIWVLNTDEGPVLWILIESMELISERPIHGASLDLEREYDRLPIRIDVINPSWFPGRDVEALVPNNATRVEFNE